MHQRSIIHFNITDFAVAVERVMDPSLREKPVLVAASSAARAVIHDMSEEAYGDGVCKGMSLAAAQRRSPQAVLLHPRPHIYQRAMGAFVKQILPFSPRVEVPDANGHIFADMSGCQRLFGDTAEVAWRVRKSARQELRLDPLWAVAANKLVAKVAARLAKPAGESVVEIGQEQEFLAPLPLKLLPGLDKKDLQLLSELNLSHIGQLTSLSTSQLAVLFGSRSQLIHEAVRGIDHSPVLAAGRQPEQVRLAHCFKEPANDWEVVEGHLIHLCGRAGRELRQRGRTARRLGLFLTYQDGGTTVRQATCTRGTDNDFFLRDLARTTLHRAWQRRLGIEQFELVLDRLVLPSQQLSLFQVHEQAERQSHLLQAMDRIRQRHGHEAIRLGR